MKFGGKNQFYRQNTVYLCRKRTFLVAFNLGLYLFSLTGVISLK